MATYKNGPLGSFSGKVGPVVGSTWRDKDILRAAPAKSSKPPSQAQLLLQQKFTDAMAFLNPMRSVFTETYKAAPTDRSGFETAKSYFLTEAMTTDGIEWQLNFPKILISQGSVRGLTNPSISVRPESILRIEWMDDSNQAMAHANDQLLVVMYIPALKEFEVFKDAGKRQDTFVDITYSPRDGALEAHCWASFGSIKTLGFAVSTYLGTVTIES